MEELIEPVVFLVVFGVWVVTILMAAKEGDRETDRQRRVGDRG